MDLISEIIEAQREMLLCRRTRDSLIRRAIADGHTGYAIAEAMKAALGEDDALAQNTIRLIGKKFVNEQKWPKGASLSSGGKPSD